MLANSADPAQQPQPSTSSVKNNQETSKEEQERINNRAQTI